MPRTPKTAGRPTTNGRRHTSWVREVAKRSDAMDLPRGIFKRSPPSIARALKRSAEQSRGPEGRTKFQSVMSMLNLYLNRAGRSVPAADRRRLGAAKAKRRTVFGRPTAPTRTRAA